MREQTKKKMEQVQAAVKSGSPVRVACKAVGLASETYKKYSRVKTRSVKSKTQVFEIPASIVQGGDRAFLFYGSPDTLSALVRGLM